MKNGMRTTILGILATMLVAFALPVGAAGPAKQFSLAFNPGSLAAGDNPNFMVRIKNESPNGNSTINSIDIVLPDNYAVYAAPQFQPAYTGNIDWTSTPGHVKITNMYPLGRGESVFLKLPINVSGSASCASSNWNQTVAWTGSSLSGNTFDRIAASALPPGYGATTTPSGALSLAFGTLPTSFVAGTSNSVTVSVTAACGTPPDTAVTLAASPAATGTGTQTTSGGATTFGVTFTTLGAVTLTASAGDATPITYSSNVFPFGSLACGADIPPSVTNPSSLLFNEPGYAFGKRGEFNAKGSTCELVNYDFANKILDPSQYIANAWDTMLQPDAAFFYSVNWQAKTLVPADLGYPPATRPKVGWQYVSNVLVLTDGLACLSTKLPRPYGRVPAGGLGAGVTSVTLDTATSPPPSPGWETLPAVGVPFPIYIGSERITATRTGGTTLSLARGQAITIDSAHAGGSYAMSTPMPVDTRGGPPSCTTAPVSPYCGKAVQMCIVSHGWQSYTPDPVTGAPRYFWVTDAIDNGDGFMSND
ncbi:MAG: hypothetical protein IT517_02595 [Burkholderiales bacterium]|nr:hypothetical protein [Burkholderiales bacterium]